MGHVGTCLLCLILHQMALIKRAALPSSGVAFLALVDTESIFGLQAGVILCTMKGRRQAMTTHRWKWENFIGK